MHTHNRSQATHNQPVRELKTYKVQYRRTNFDRVRDLEVMAENDTQVRECVQDCEGSRVIILCVQLKDTQVSVR